MKILIVKTSSLGDIIQSYPVLAYLKKQFPDAEIDWVVEKPFAELLQAHPLINHVWTIDSKRWRTTLYHPKTLSEMWNLRKQVNSRNYDLLYDLQGNLKSGLLISQMKVKTKVGFGWNTVHEKFNTFFTNIRYESVKGVNIRDDYLSLAQAHNSDKSLFEDPGVRLRISNDQESQILNLLSDTRLIPKPRIMVCPGSAWQNKQVTIEAMIRFLEKAKDDLGCSYLFVWGSEEEKLIAEKLQTHFVDRSVVVARLRLPVLQNLMDRLDLVIAMDSLPLHLAGTTTTPTFSIFGASLAEKFKPKGDRHLAMQGGCPFGRKFPKRCPVLRTCPTGDCIRKLDGAEVYEYFRNCYKG